MSAKPRQRQAETIHREGQIPDDKFGLRDPTWQNSQPDPFIPRLFYYLLLVG